MRRTLLLLVGIGLTGLVAWLIAHELAHAPRGIAIAVVVIAILGCSGLGLIWTGEGVAKSRSDIGKALLAGVLIGAATIWLQVEIQNSIEHSAERQNLRLTLNLQHDLVGIDVHHQNLRGLYLSYKDLRHANLRSTQLQKTELPGSNLQYAYMEGTNLEEAVLNNTHLSNTHLQEVQARRVNFTEASGTETRLEGAHFVKAIFTDAVLRQAYMSGAVLNEAELEGADFRKAQADHASIEDVRAARV